MNKYLYSRVTSGLIWNAFQQFGTQTAQFVFSIILARILVPEDFGIVAINTAFVAFVRVFIDGGFGQAIIQKKDLSEADLSSVFFLNLLLSIIIYSIIFYFSPLVAAFFNIEKLTLLLQIQAIVILIGAFDVVQNALMSRNMLFKKCFFCNSLATFVQGFTGITLAILDFGIWSLVYAQIARSLTYVIVLWSVMDWSFQWSFSPSRLKGLFRFGVGIMGTNLINSLSNNIHTLIIGKTFSPVMLGYYNRGQQLPNLLVNNISEPMSAVLFPAMAIMQDRPEDIKKLMRKIITAGCFITFPLMVLLAIISKPLVVLLLTEKWLLCVPFVQFACIKFAISPMHNANLQAIKAIGRSDVFFKISVLKITFTFIILFFTLPFGIYAVAIGAALSSFAHLIINIHSSSRYLNYGFKEQFSDIIPIVILNVISCIVVFLYKPLHLNMYSEMILQVLSFPMIYLLLTKILDLDVFDRIKQEIFYSKQSV